MNILSKIWDWKVSAIALGVIFLLTIILVKPIGVSTQFVILDGIIWNSTSSELIIDKEDTKYGYESSNAYLNKSSAKYAKNVENPLNYSFVFVIAMLIGGLISSKLSQEKVEQSCKVCDEAKLSSTKRYIFVFIGGILVLFGARLAGGCTSGHFMSGMSQMAISSMLFGGVVMITLVVTGKYFYNINGEE